MFKSKDELSHITGQDLEDLIENNNLQIIDIREPYEIELTSIPNTMKIPINMLLRVYQEILDINTTYYILCHTGQRSYYATKILTEAGYMAVNVLGGIRAMKKYYVHY
ncbi:MAG: rhodanese-like domain-containing protein [Bacilli bacterium]|nr:rhodanese-like domain-containing protein [Bacilli bacterium]